MRTSPIPLKRKRRIPRRHAAGVLATIASAALFIQQAQPLCGVLRNLNPRAGEICAVVTGIAREVSKQAAPPSDASTDGGAL